MRTSSSKRAPTTVTVGIPAYNEERHIRLLLQSIARQQERGFIIERIIVVCDGCTDRTADVVRKFAVQESRVELCDDGRRLGKVGRLNEIYRMNRSELLITIDGDVWPATNREFERLVAVWERSPQAAVVGGHIEPFPIGPRAGFVARSLHANYLMWNAIVNNVNGGDHIHNLQGPASLLRGDFAASVRYPEHITCDEGFLYAMAKKNGGFRFAHNTRFLTATLHTLKDITIGVPRYLNERHDLVPYFGKDILRSYNVPFIAKMKGVMTFMIRNPVATFGALVYNLWIKLAFIQDAGYGSAIWERIGT